MQPTGRELLANRAGGARQQHAHITFSSSITESPPFFLHPRRHVGQSDEIARPLFTEVGGQRKEQGIRLDPSRPMRSIGQRRGQLPTRAGNVSAKGGSVCTCIVSKQQYGGPLALRLSMGCRASCLFAAGARRDHIWSRRLRVAHDRKMIRSFAQNPVRSLQSDVQKFPDRVTSHFGSDYDSIMIDLGMNGN